MGCKQANKTRKAIERNLRAQLRNEDGSKRMTAVDLVRSVGIPGNVHTDWEIMQERKELNRSNDPLALGLSKWVSGGPTARDGKSYKETDCVGDRSQRFPLSILTLRCLIDIQHDY